MSWFKTTVNAAKAWMSDNAFKHCAAVSYYTLFSLAPITIIVVGVVSLFVGEEQANKQLRAQLTQLVGKQSSDMILQTMEAGKSMGRGWISTAVGVALLLVGATTVFAQLQDSF